MQDAPAQSNGQKTTASLRSFFSRLSLKKGKMNVTVSDEQPPKVLQDWSTYLFREATVATLRAYLLEGGAALIKSGIPTPEQLEDAGVSFWSAYCEARGGAEITGFIQSKRALIQRAGRINRVNALLLSARMIWCDELINELESEERYFKEVAALRSAKTEDEYNRALNSIEAKIKSDALRLEELADDGDPSKKDTRSEQQKKKEASDGLTNEIVAIEEMLKMQINEDTTKLEKYCGYVRRLHHYIAAHNKK